MAEDPIVAKACEIYESVLEMRQPVDAAAALVGAHIMLFRRLKFNRAKVIAAAEAHMAAFMEEFPEE